MSKKLIAVASAAALALSALVAMPTVANATGPFAVTVSGQETTNTVNTRTGATAAGALQIFVPSNDVIRSVATATNDLPAGSSTALRLDIKTPGATDAITVTATGGVEVITATQFAAASTTTATGVQSLTVPAAAGDATIYAYTTSTTAGTVVISAAGSSRTLHIQGLSRVQHNMYKFAFSAATTSAISGTIAITGTIRDMFDNLLTPTASNLLVTTMGGTLTGAAVTPSDFLVNATTSVITFTVPASTTASNMAVGVSAATATPAATAVTAFPGRAASSFFTVEAVNLAAQITTLNAQITALNAQLAALTASTVTKAKYNKLVRKWNRANPNNKVARSL